VRIVREVEARRRVGGIPTRVDPERTNLPVGRNGAHQEENQDQRAEEQDESKPPPPPPVRLGAGDLSSGCRNRRRRGGNEFLDGFRDRLGNRFRGWLRRRLSGRDLLLCGHRLGWGGLDRRGCGGGRDPTRQPGQPLVQLGLIGQRSRIVWLHGTPGDEAHLRPTLPPPDYGPCFARGRSAMPL